MTPWYAKRSEYRRDDNRVRRPCPCGGHKPKAVKA